MSRGCVGPFEPVAASFMHECMAIAPFAGCTSNSAYGMTDVRLLYAGNEHVCGITTTLQRCTTCHKSTSNGDLGANDGNRDSDSSNAMLHPVDPHTICSKSGKHIVHGNCCEAEPRSTHAYIIIV
jgi:hypothetical protein